MTLLQSGGKRENARQARSAPVGYFIPPHTLRARLEKERDVVFEHNDILIALQAKVTLQ